jgi:fatty acid desaturase
MSRARRIKRRRAAVDLSIELAWLFFIGFALASLVGIAIAWVFGLHHGEENPWEDESRSISARSRRGPA